jgi:predicted TIM-barrel fold metal-dependent hydrolase
MPRSLLAIVMLLLPTLPAWATPPLFDTHLHYNAEHGGQFSPADIITTLRANGVRHALVTGRPPEQVLDLHRQAPELIVPLLGVYRTAEDKQHWMRDSALPTRVEAQLQQGPWRGIGELHLFAGQRHSPVFLRLVELATARGLPLLMHCDPAVIDSLFHHAPDATVIWAHAGAYPYPPLLADYLARYPGLYVDLSVRDERIAPGGDLQPEWENLLLEHSDRFMAGVDTYRTARWGDYGRVASLIRGWLAQLPDEVASQIAFGNAVRVLKMTPGQ